MTAIYHYHPETRVYFGVGQADPDPLRFGGWLVPAHATTIAPPSEIPVDHVARFDGEAWQVEALPQPDTVAVRRAEILARLGQIDLESLRPLRAIATSIEDTTDTEKLAILEAEAVTLRSELASLAT